MKTNLRYKILYGEPYEVNTELREWLENTRHNPTIVSTSQCAMYSSKDGQMSLVCLTIFYTIETPATP